MSKQRVCVALLLDRSGSMEGHKTETVSAVNTYIQGLKEKFKGRFTLTQFDSGGIDIVHNNVKIKDIPEFLTFTPRGMTPLLDAIGKTMAEVKSEGFDNVIFVIVTDGQENASHEYTLAAIRTLLKEKREKFGWQVSYIGANVDAFGEAHNLGIAKGQAMNFASAHSSNAMASYLTSNERYAGRSSTLDLDGADFTDEERDEAVGETSAG